ncbi:MAG: hypothetical protein WC412_06650 [Candidatus Omnitrophota bacterium]|jgi:predicted lipid-binding transport protein (Tim44 family)
MKKLFSIILCMCLVAVFAGCENNKTRVGEGAVIGGLLGGAAGGIIGHQSGNAGAGAGIGIAAGAVTGAIIGSQIKKPQKEGQVQNTTASTESPQAQESISENGQLSIEQIVEMTQQGKKDDEIIAKIHSTNSKFNLSAEGINYLKQQGVSQKVIDSMQGK